MGVVLSIVGVAAVVPAASSAAEAPTGTAASNQVETGEELPGPGDDVATGTAMPGTAPDEVVGGRSVAEEAALSRASETGKPVEVVEDRGESHEVWALATGALERREFVVPRWARGDGGWVRVDTTLAAASDGVVTPAASTVDVEFSGGGETAPLVRLTRDARVMEWTWPGALPAPALNGDTATYADVIDGVDLQMTATERGFASFLVVKTAEAAASPELEEIRFDLDTEGLDVSVAQDGGLTALDQGSDAVVFEAPPAAMWEQGGQAAEPSGGGGDGAARVAGTTAEPERGPAVADEGAVAPVEVTVSADQDELTLVPDQALLQDPETTFPVVIDPRVATPGRTAWTATNKSYPSTSYWQFRGDADEGLGTCEGWAGCAGGSTYRLFYQFDVSTFKGKGISSAKFRVENTHSAQCTARTVHLYHTKGINSSTTWNTQAATGFFKKLVTSKSFSYGGNQDPCKSPGVAEFSVTSLIEQGAAAGWNTVALGLRADSETDKYHWKRFSKNAYLQVVYNSVPRQVKTSALALKYGGECSDTTLASPVRIRTAESNLMGVHTGAATDPDGEAIRVQFRVTSSDGSVDTTLSTPWKKSGSYFSMNMPKVPANVRIGWIVRVQDRQLDGEGVSSSGPWSSPGCYFVVDTSMPKAPVITSDNNEYPEPDPSDPEDMPHGGAGEYGWFTIDSSSSDVVRYEYQFSGGSIVKKAGGQVRVAYLPQDPGDHRLTATAFDAAGNKATSTYDFRVDYGRDPVGNWTFDDPVDGEQAPTGFTLAGNAQVVDPGRDRAAEGNALRLDGSGDWAQSSGGSVSTAGHFSVEAWAKVDSLPTSPAMVASRGGSSQLGFMLYLSSAQDRWVFGQDKSDAPGSVGSKVISQVPVTLGKWTHLLGVVDAYRKTMQLYVNGVPTTEVAMPERWAATGDTYIGAAKYGTSAPSLPFKGDIDSVRSYNRIVTATEASALATRIPQVGARWTFEEADTTGASILNAVRDESGEALPPSLALGAGAVRSSAPGAASVDDYGLVLDGKDDYAATDLDTVPIAVDESFTIAGWMRATGDSLASKRTVLALTGDVEESVQLRYIPNGKTDELAGGDWMLVLREQNATGAEYHDVRIDAGFASDWHHFAIVYDAPRQVARLYIDGALSEDGGSTDPGATAFSQVRRLSLGRGLSAGSWVEYWPGGMDDVWLFRGALNQTQVKSLYTAPSGMETVVPGAAG
ncbi:LamG-like jellyroll fold domain-containing protein [Isoptericola sp. NPDC057391]|uniref:LamG-like jellyroll fold domain-containing protein n=1 Tax=Isoptericola sp. NPDC057391 TaxID=3346117 RepID=UPI00362A5F26